MGDKKEKPPDLATAAHKLIVLSLDLVPKELAAMPETLNEALKRPDFLEKVEEEMRGRALAIMRAQLDASPEAAAQRRKIAVEIAESYGKQAGNAMKRQLELSPRVAQIKGAVRQLGEAFKASPVGVFIDEHKGIVYVVGAALAISGGVAIWYSRNETLGEGVRQLTDMADIGTKIGKFELKGKLAKFDPSKKSITGKLSLSTDLKRVKVELNVLGGLNGPNVTVASDGRLLVPLGRNESLLIAGRVAGDIPTGDATPGPHGAEPGAGVHGPSANVRFDLGVGVNIKRDGLEIDTLGYLRQTDYLNSFPGAVFADPTVAGLAGGVNKSPGALTPGLGIRLRGRLLTTPLGISGGAFLEGAPGRGFATGGMVGVWWK